MAEVIWRIEQGEGPVVAMAIHDGHAVRAEVRQHLALSEEVRLREEDPFTGQWTVVAPTRVVGLRSRFEVDLNRPREKAVYLTPEDAWGLKVWTGELPEDVIVRSFDSDDTVRPISVMGGDDIAELANFEYELVLLGNWDQQ